MHQKTINELRCFCRRRPLLAVYGLDSKNKVYIHVKVYKNRRIYGEILVTEGVVHLHCRECMRWHRIVIRPEGRPELIESDPPEGMIEEEATVHD